MADCVYDSVPLSERHRVDNFSCGVAELDEWLRDYARHASAMNTSRTFVWSEPDDTVVGYYSLAAHQVAREELPHRVARGGPNRIPAVLIGKLAIDGRLQGGGRKSGAAILVDALQRILDATQVVAARVVVVDAISENAIGFYERFGFVRTAPESYRLIRKLSDIAADFAE